MMRAGAPQQQVVHRLNEVAEQQSIHSSHKTERSRSLSTLCMNLEEPRLTVTVTVTLTETPRNDESQFPKSLSLRVRPGDWQRIEESPIPIVEDLCLAKGESS